MKISIFIVDDEPLIVEGLLATIGSLGLPVNVVGYAYSGELALEEIKQKRPQILLCDIRMRKMSGLELCRQVYMLFPQIKTIFLSGYSDFSYIQTALKYQAADYLLKPVQAGELSASLLRAMQAIEQQQKNKHTIVQLRNYLDASRPYIRELFFAYIKTFPYAESEQFPLYQIFEIPPQTELFLPLHIAFPGVESLFDPAAFETNDSLFHLVDCSLTAQELPHLSFFDSDSLLYILLLTPDASVSLSAVEEAAERVRELLILNKSPVFSIGIGNAVKTLAEVPDAALSAKRASSFHFLLGLNNVLSARDAAFLEVSGDAAGTDTFEDAIVQSVYAENVDSTDKNIRRYLLHLCSADAQLPSVQQNVIELFFHLLNSVFANTQERERLSDDARDFTGCLWRAVSVAEIQALLYGYCVRCIEYLHVRRNDKTSALIVQIKQIIEQDYKDVSLNSICDRIGLSPSYTSNLFSSIEKSTIKSYIIATKIRIAKTMLCDPSVRIYEVAEAVGYADTKYFSQMFRKQTGLSPEQYRQQLGCS